MKKIISIVFLFVCIVLGVVIGNSFHHATPPKQVTQTLSAKTTLPTTTTAVIPPTSTPRVTTSASPGIPQTIAIPAIHLTAPVEEVALDSEKRMDVPKKAMDVGWYSPPFRPGANGNAVLDGHLDMVTGAPAVFWDVKKLQKGDEITITDDSNKAYTFVVTKQVAYDYNNLPLNDIFAASSTPHLNLITCNGTWDKVNKNYSQRVVVYADLKN